MPVALSPVATPRASVSMNAGYQAFIDIAEGHHVKVAKAGVEKPWTDSNEISTVAGMEELAKKLNPTIGTLPLRFDCLDVCPPRQPTITGFFDPLGILREDESLKETIGWFRHAEIKHGRVAMAAFVGYCVQANGICFPWSQSGNHSILLISFGSSVWS